MLSVLIIFTFIFKHWRDTLELYLPAKFRVSKYEAKRKYRRNSMGKKFIAKADEISSAGEILSVVGRLDKLQIGEIDC